MGSRGGRIRASGIATAIAIGLAVALGGCGGGPGADASEPTTRSSSTTVAAHKSALSDQAGNPIELLPIPAGPGETVEFRPHFRYTAPPGWSTFGDEPTQILASRQTTPTARAVVMIRDVTGASPELLANRLQHVNGFEAGPLGRGAVGNRVGIELEGRAVATAELIPLVPGPWVQLDPGERARITIIDVHGVTVVVFVVATGAELESFLPDADALLATVQFT